MNFVDVVKGRRSIRKFLPDPVPEEDIKEIIRIGTQAPSAKNRQDWRILAIKNSELKQQMKTIVQEKLVTFANQAGAKSPENYKQRHTCTFFADAPLALVVLSKPFRGDIDELLETAGYSEAEIDYLRMRPDLQTTGGLVQTILLAAYSLGYGSCWMISPNNARHELEHLLKVRPPWSMAATIAIGRPAHKPSTKEIKPVSEVLEIIN